MTLLLEPIITQLDAANMGINKISDIEDFAALDQKSFATNAIYVGPVSETGSENTRAGSETVRQVITHEFAAILALKTAVRAKNKFNENLKTYTDAIKDALVGWKHPDAISLTTFRRGFTVGFGAGRLAYQQNFILRTQETTS